MYVRLYALRMYAYAASYTGSVDPATENLKK